MKGFVFFFGLGVLFTAPEEGADEPAMRHAEGHDVVGVGGVELAEAGASEEASRGPRHPAAQDQRGGGCDTAEHDHIDGEGLLEGGALKGLDDAVHSDDGTA